MKLKEYLGNSKLIQTLDAYTMPKEEDKTTLAAGSALKSIYHNAQSNQMIVPVLGMQGMGKSTLINAILGKNILPNDADETTCVPVEVCYGDTEYAEVFFKDRKNTEIVYTREELNAFVDNNENPANQKQVSKIVLYDQLPLLQNGMVIVDLPGVGSMTAANADTTHHYIKNLCTAIFVIPTTPTIRKQEAIFIKSVWSQFPTAIFVQNLWDENPRELQESVEYNTLILKKIAKELNTSFNGEIIVVNAYDALIGGLQHNDEQVKKANLPALFSELHRFSETWEKNMYQSIFSKLYYVIQYVSTIIQKRIHELDISKEQIQQECEERLNQFKEQTKKIRRKIREVDDYLDEIEAKVKEIAQQKADECTSGIRREIFNLIDKGVTDGEQLTDAFKNYQEEYVPDALNGMFVEFQQIKIDLEAKLEELESIQLKNDMHSQIMRFDNGDALKFEKTFAPVCGVAGTIGGVALGGLVNGALMTALSVEAVTITNPVTLIPGLVALAVTTVVGIIGGAIGNAAKKGVSNVRIDKTKKEIAPYIDEIQSSVYNTIIDEFNKIRQNVTAVLEQLKETRKDVQTKLEEEIYSVEEIEHGDRNKMEADNQYLKAVLKEMEQDA